MSLHVSVGGVNKKVKRVHVSVGGVWKNVTNAWNSEGNVFKKWWAWTDTPVLAGTSLSAHADNGANNTNASVEITYNTNGTVTRNAFASTGSASPGSPVPNWNTYGGAYVSWQQVSWNQSNACFPEGTVPEGQRYPMTNAFAVGAYANYNNADPPGQSGNGSIQMSIWAAASGGVPITTQTFNFSVSAS